MAAQSNAPQTFEDLVAAVKQAESRGKRYASDGKLTTSPKGALGEMQVMPGTIKDPGFGVTPATSSSPDEIARVGRDYLQAMKQKYGDTEKALIAYNWGPGSTDKWIAAGADPKKLPEETRTYVQRVKGLLGKNVSRETKETGPTPAEEMMTKALPAGTTANVSRETLMKSMPDVKSMPASYQAAFALAALADAQDEEDDRVYNENKDTETEAFFAGYKPVNHLASLELEVKPVMMADGGEVTERKDEPLFDAASRTFVDVLTGRREPITEKDFTAREQLAMMDAVKRSQARGGKGRVDYQDYPTGDKIGPGFVDIRNTLGGFQYKQMPDGSTVISDRYDFHGPRAGEYEKMGTGEKVLKSAANALSAFVRSGGGVRDAAGEIGDAWIGKSGPQVNIRIPPVKRAEGSPKEGERKLDRETIALMRGEGMQPAAMTRIKPPLELNPSAAGLPGLMMYNDPSLPGTGTAGYVMMGDDSAKNPAMAQAMFLNPKEGNNPDTIAHETEHLLARQNLGRGSNINTKFDELIGDNGLKRIQFVQKAVQAAPYLKEKYGLQSAYFTPEMVEFQGRRAKNLLYEQLASLSALEQRHKIDLTKDEELRKTLFAHPAVRETYNALTGLRQTRLDPRDLPPHTRVAEPGIFDSIKGVFKRADGGPVYRADGSPEEGEMSKPYIGNPNIRKQGEAARRLAAMRDVNTLPDPKTYAAVSGLLGTAPDQMGFSVMHPKAAEIRAVADPAFAVGTALGVAPALQVMGAGKVAEKTGEAAKMLARDFQQYNQQLDVPGASYAIRNRGTPFLNTPPQVNYKGKVEREAMGEADDYADWLARTFGREPALKTWLRDKVGAYLRRDFGTESDQMVQAADQGKKLHFMSPKLTENVPHQLSADIGLARELEGFPKSGFAKTPQGQKVEEVIDSTIYPLQLQDIGMSYKVPKSMEQFVGIHPEMRVSQMGPIDENLKFDELAQLMEKMFKEKEFRAYGESVPMPKEYILTDETLKGLTPAQASNRVANKLAWVEKKRGELAGVAIAKDPQIVSHSYDNGSKWISPADLADNPHHADMVKDIGCAGGWCTDKDTFALDYGSGENRLNILLDKKFEPRVQLTVNSPPTTVREFILANPHLPEIDAIAQNRTITAREVDRLIKAMPEYLDFVKRNENSKNITEIKGQFNNSDLRNSPYLKQVQDFVKRQGPDLQSVYNLDGIDMLDMRVELPSMRQYGKGNYSQGLLEKLLQVNGNSYFAGKDEFPDLIKKAYELPNNAARQIQMNMFQPPTQRATGGMIERQPNDNRRYL